MTESFLMTMCIILLKRLHEKSQLSGIYYNPGKIRISNWLNTKYMIRAGVLTMLLLFPSLLSATCRTDTIIRNYKPDSLKLVIKADSIIAFHEGDSAFTIVKGRHSTALCSRTGSSHRLRQTCPSLPQKLGTLNHSDPL